MIKYSKLIASSLVIATVAFPIIFNKVSIEDKSITKDNYSLVQNLKSDIATNQETILTNFLVKKIGWDKKTIITLSDWKTTLPNIVSIDSHAFAETQIVSIEIPNSVKLLSQDALAGNQITDITMPTSLKIDSAAKYGFTQAQWNAINWVYVVSDATIITLEILQSVGFDTKKIITLEDWQTYLPLASTIRGAFNENKILESIEFPESITRIEDNSFRAASNLETIKFNGSNLTTLGFDAFRATKISSIIIPPSVKQISQGVFSQCLFLTSVVLPPMLTSISTGLFETTPLLKEVVIPETITSIEMNAFGYSGIEKLVLPPSVVSINSTAFKQTLNLTDIRMNIKLQGNDAKKYGFTQDQWNLIKWDSSLTKDVVVSLGWDQKTTISLEDWREVAPNITTIDNAFVDNILLTSIEIPSYILDIGINSFQNATSLEFVVFEPDSQLKNIGHQAFFGTNLQSIDIPKSVTTIYFDSFGNNLNLNNISMGHNFKTEVENFGFTKNQWDNINWIYYSTNENILTMEIIQLLGWDQKTTITLNDWKEMAPNVTIINSAFFNNINLTYIEIPNSILSIELNSFKNTESLTKIMFEQNSQLQFIGNEAFSNSALKSIEIPNSVILIGDSAFKDTKFLKDIRISNKLETYIDHFGFTDAQWNSIVWTPVDLNVKFIALISSLGFIMIIQLFVVVYSALQIKKIDV